MSSEDKALEMVNKFSKLLPCEGMTTGQTPIDCAIIAVDEILNQYNSGKFDYKILDEEESNYWQEVKNEIEKL